MVTDGINNSIIMGGWVGGVGVSFISIPSYLIYVLLVQPQFLVVKQ